MFTNIKFKNKYRIASVRLKTHNYSSEGYYFVTVCTKNRECYFGDIINKKMQLSKIGKIADQCWQIIPGHFPFVELDGYIVMPNHLHGIIVINKPTNVETQNFASLRIRTRIQHGNKFGPQSSNLASIVRGFKIGVKKWTNEKQISFYWQTRYYDHIIRNEQSLNKIREYIINNPKNWKKDRDNIENYAEI